MNKKVFDNNGLEERMVHHRVELLIKLAQTMAASPEKHITADQSESMKKLIEQTGQDEWVFFSSASLFSMNIGAIIKDYDRLGRINLTGIVSKELNKVDTRLVKAIGDFRKFTSDRKFDEDEQIANIGLWLVWNLKQETPEKEDYELIAAIGKLQLEQARKVRESLFYRSLN